MTSEKLADQIVAGQAALFSVKVRIMCLIGSLSGVLDEGRAVGA